MKDKVVYGRFIFINAIFNFLFGYIWVLAFNPNWDLSTTCSAYIMMLIFAGVVSYYISIIK